MEVVIVILVALWVLGIITIPGLIVPKVHLFSFMGHAVTLYDLFLVVIAWWLITHLPSPLREIALVLLILWVLSLFGIIALAGASSFFAIGLVAGTILYLISKVF